jgi:hypothetical protein
MLNPVLRLARWMRGPVATRENPCANLLFLDFNLDLDLDRA